jgi:RNA polymerase sigma factor (sigma-70 family)
MATTAPAAVTTTSLLPLAALGDDALAGRVRAGDDAAFEELYRRHHADLFRYCASVLGDPHDAEEALQGAMLGAYRALQRHGGDRDLRVRAWLYRIAHNQCIDAVRRRRAADQLSELHEAPGPRVDERVAVREDVRQLRRDLAALAPGQRAALLLRELSGLSHAEIAATLDATPATAKQLIHDARRSLAAFATGRGMACADVQRRISDRDGRVLRGAAIRGHLRACPDCARFRDAIGERSARLPCLAPPLAPLAAEGILAGVLQAQGGLAAGGAAMAGGAAAGAAGGGGLALKLAAIGATAVAGAAAAVGPLAPADAPAPPARVAAAAAQDGPAPDAAAALDADARPAAARVRARVARQPAAPDPAPSPPAPEPAPAQAGAGAPPPAPAGPEANETPGAAGAPPPPAAVAARAGAPPLGASVTAGAGAGGIDVAAQAGPVTATAGADLGAGAVAADVGAGPVAVSAGADLPAASATVSAQTPIVSANVTVGRGGLGIAVGPPAGAPSPPR